MHKCQSRAVNIVSNLSQLVRGCSAACGIGGFGTKTYSQASTGHSSVTSQDSGVNSGVSWDRSPVHVSAQGRRVVTYIIPSLHGGFVMFRHVGAQQCKTDFVGLKIPRLTRMNGTPKTVAEMARMGGLARAKAYSKARLRAWGKQGGRPASLDGKALARLRGLLRAGKSQAECATILGVSVRTIGRVVARMKANSRIWRARLNPHQPASRHATPGGALLPRSGFLALSGPSPWLA